MSSGPEPAAQERPKTDKILENYKKKTSAGPETMGENISRTKATHPIPSNVANYSS